MIVALNTPSRELYLQPKTGNKSHSWAFARALYCAIKLLHLSKYDHTSTITDLGFITKLQQMDDFANMQIM